MTSLSRLFVDGMPDDAPDDFRAQNITNGKAGERADKAVGQTPEYSSR